ncbi:MAG: bifunctional 4-hydroxy-2-oxoglutarate aldolase/2-dehydro-3-deoxy-phosphogluconate aldolase, partial [Candidatus Omnitrophica bacterium]|nr:bifunctional 4-hydroxy-2-oxoglutarate aldolase/2-dehydro-3-deoxy-phosphogluconate aldolase [Candidatus Omnitrophota bacterium]
MNQTLKWFEDYKLIATIRSSSTEDAEAMIKAAMDGGFHLFEISMQTPQAVRLIENYSKRDDCFLGVFAVTDGEMAQRAINAGAKFVSSSYVDRDIITVAKHNDVFVIQGVMTPTEA